VRPRLRLCCPHLLVTEAGGKAVHPGWCTSCAACRHSLHLRCSDRADQLHANSAASAPALNPRALFRRAARRAQVLQGEALKVMMAMRVKLQDFQGHLPLITALSNPGLRGRHWLQISAKVGFPVKADAGA
jgi:hypothetical protein